MAAKKDTAPKTAAPAADKKAALETALAQIETTEVYARADAEMKRKALETANLDLPAESQTSWQKDQSLLSWLQSL